MDGLSSVSSPFRQHRSSIWHVSESLACLLGHRETEDHQGSEKSASLQLAEEHFRGCAVQSSSFGLLEIQHLADLHRPRLIRAVDWNSTRKSWEV